MTPIPMSRGVTDATRATTVRCSRCGAELATVDGGDDVRSAPVCDCRIRRRPAADPHDPIAPRRSR